jgi:predicted nucleotide-binding protein
MTSESPKVVRALFVDDEDTLRDQYIENIAIALKDSCNVTLSPKSVRRIEEAKAELPTGQEVYKIVFVDLLWNSIGSDVGKRDSRGLEVVRQAAKTKDVIIVAFSVGDTINFPKLKEDAIAYGAHIFMYRGTLQADSRYGSWEELAKNICSLLAGEPSSLHGSDQQTPGSPRIDTSMIFVVCGRNSKLNKSLFEFLRALHLRPMEWSELVSGLMKEGRQRGNATITEIVSYGFTKSHGALVFFTPDDEARLRESLRETHDPEHESQLSLQPRPNVLFEAGFALAFNPARTLLIQAGGNLRPISDLSGLHITRLDNSADNRNMVAQQLQDLGFDVHRDGKDWLTAGDFS